MYDSSVILTLQADSQAAIEYSMQRLKLAGFQVIRSFDLKVARAAHIDCTCPYHGTDQCDCQMVVLLVYAQDEPPVTLVVHGYDGQAQIALVETTEQQPTDQFVDAIREAILPTGGRAEKRGRKTTSFGLENEYHAG
jgi:hypothetical protein